MTEPIRPATADDAAACAHVLQGWMHRAAWMSDDEDEAELERMLRQRLPMREAYVIGSPVVGYVSMEPDIAHIWALYVATPNQGLGRALLDRAKQGRAFLQLNVHEANTPAQAFFAHQGFTPTGDFWMGWDGLQETRMEWRA